MLWWGSLMIVVSAVFALVYSVKTAVLGFFLLGYGVYKAGMTPLPPMMMMAFLCLYSGAGVALPPGRPHTPTTTHRPCPQRRPLIPPPAVHGPGNAGPRRDTPASPYASLFVRVPD